MAEEKLLNETGEAVDNADYIAAIKELKENSVDRSKYDALRADNKRLLDSLVNGQTIDAQAQKPQVDVDALRKELFQGEALSNVAYAEKALALRDALIEKGERDPFLPYGQKIAPTDEDVRTAEKVAAVLKECVEYAEGDNEVFTNELMRHTVDIPTPRRK